MKKRCTALLLMLAILIIPAAAASTYRKQIAVDYGISLYFNDDAIILKDPNGNTVQPFVYGGTTYVPIRAVSETFGAAVFYDSGENAAYIYDDFSEVCAVVNEMHNIITDCYNLILTEMYSTPKDYSSVFAECDQNINNFYDTLSYLTSDENYNVNSSIVMDEIMPSYQAFILSFAEVHKNYNSYLASSNSYTTNKFVDSLHDAIDKYYTARQTIDSFYDDYCDWRNIVK